MNNDDLLQQIRKIVREEVKAEAEPIKKVLQEQGKKIDILLDVANRTQTAIETLDEKIDATKIEVDEIKRHQRPQKAD